MVGKERSECHKPYPTSWQHSRILEVKTCTWAIKENNANVNTEKNSAVAGAEIITLFSFCSYMCVFST